MVSKLSIEDVNLGDLRLFAKAAELSGLAAAARVLGLPKASATRQLQRLETVMGRRLIHRDGRRFALTEDGRLLLPYAARVLADIDESMQALRAHGAPLTGTLRIASPYTYGRKVIGPKIARFMALHPALTIALNLSSSPVDLLRDEADVAIRIGATGSNNTIVRQLSRVTFVLCASPGYLARASRLAEVEDLYNHAVLDIRTESSPTSMDLIGQDQLQRLRLTPALTSNEPEVLIQAALQHRGIAVVARAFADEHFVTGALVHVLPGWSPPSRDVNALYAPGRGQSPKVRAFLDFLIAELNRDPPDIMQ
jgi:LysR family transcriptional regulator, regulator for bpeEF and oprC